MTQIIEATVIVFALVAIVAIAWAVDRRKQRDEKERLYNAARTEHEKEDN